MPESHIGKIIAAFVNYPGKRKSAGQEMALSGETYSTAIEREYPITA